MAIEVLPATGARYADVATLLAPKTEGGRACWCLSYRLSAAEKRAIDGDGPVGSGRAEYVRSLCDRDLPPGLLAYEDGDIAGWVSVGPRAEFNSLTHSRTIPTVDDLPVWSVLCFVVRPGFRRRGVAHRMLEQAVAFARDHGAPAVEGYPVDTAGARVSGTQLFVGTTSLFESAGFDRVVETSAHSAGLTRWVMRRSF